VPVLTRYAFGKDFAESDYHKWHDQLTWWCAEQFPEKAKDPREYADKVIRAALNGTKLDGGEWVGVPLGFFSRVRMLCGFDLERGIGTRTAKGRPKQRFSITNASGDRVEQLPEISLKETIDQRNAYVADLLIKYPHLDNPVYKPKVDELAETIVKSRALSNEFITANGKNLEMLSRIRESLHTQISQLMKFLEIAPEQRVKKALDTKNTDVGSLVNKLESYADIWKEYEKVDALRELIQIYKMLHSQRPDGTPQLQAWECWHMTRSKPIKYTCRCGQTVELVGGFEPEEIEAALLQAQKVFGFGLEGIEKRESVIATDGHLEVLDTGFTVQDVLAPPTEEDDS
jgi:hypothetical protein